MWFCFVIFQGLTALLWASLGSLRGSWEVLGEPLGVLGRPFVVLGGPWWFLVCPLGVPGLGGPQEALGGPRGGAKRDRKHIGLSRSVWGGLWGVLGVIWSSGVVIRSSPGDANIYIPLALRVF